ncbi:alpha-L-arabinofuranosidase C-terminal domain-containing protein [Streptomyces sp. NPDC058464]|uniref:alpha-L-arabinofuranosidase C-terminal domain-containing protein n=1 Tax=Streptomyces sp. NPDC058464 TaxID=3346511 RepID=UPI00365C5B95
MVDVVLDPRRVTGRVDPMVFGSFVENLHRCVYGGLFDPDSPVADDEGFRTDVIATARAMKVSNVRFPGGCFAAYYHWKDGIGPREQRPRTRYRADDTWPASNAVGTDEFVAWCRKVGAEPYLCVNMGTGTAEAARDWVEYCNGRAGSRWADARIAGGHAEPYGVRYWALGNEISGPWEQGYTATAEEYIQRARDFAMAMKAADPTISLVVSGAHFPIDFPQPHWNRDVLAALYEYADYVSMHHYIGHDYKDDIRTRYPSMSTREVHDFLTEHMRLLEDAIGLLREDIKLVNHSRGVAVNRIGIALDEYNAWYKTDGSQGDDLVETYPLSDALLIGAYFNIFLRNADVLRLANMAQLVNTLPAMVVESGGSGAFRQGISYVQELFAASAGLQAIDVWCDSPARPGSYYPNVAHLDVSASYDSAAREIQLFAVNRDPDQAYPLNLVSPAGALRVRETAVIGGDSLDAANSFAEPSAIRIDRGPVSEERPPVVPPAAVLRVTLTLE